MPRTWRSAPRKEATGYDPTVQAVGLRKRFGKTTALDGLDQAPSLGQVLAVLGATANQRPR